MEQLKIIEKVKDIALADERISAVLMYGSFIRGEGDRYSDVEFYVFTREETDSKEWVNHIAPVAAFFRNEFGTEVAIFENLIRGEFHFHPVSDIPIVKTWEGFTSFQYRDKMLLVDKDGLLFPVLDSIERIEPDCYSPENIESIAQMLVNYLIFCRNLINRGETAHAHQLFVFIHRALLWLIRIYTGNTQHWEAPTKKLEEDIPESWYEKYKSCVPGLDPNQLVRCYNNSLDIAHELFISVEVPCYLQDLLKRIEKLK